MTSRQPLPGSITAVARAAGFEVPGNGSKVSVRCFFHEDENPSAFLDEQTGCFYCSVCTPDGGWGIRRFAEALGVEQHGIGPPGGRRGAPRQVFWGGFVEPFLKEIIRKSVEHAATLADEHGIDRAAAFQAIRSLMRMVVGSASHAMEKVEISQMNHESQFILTGKHTPVRRTDTRPMVDRMYAFVDAIISDWPAKRPRLEGAPVEARQPAGASAGMAALATASTPPAQSGAWSASRRGGMPLRGWAEICRALGVLNDRSRQVQIRRLNDTTGGPIVWVERTPETDSGEIKAWIEDREGRAEAAARRRQDRQTAVDDLSRGHPEYLADQGLHHVKRPNDQGSLPGQ